MQRGQVQTLCLSTFFYESVLSSNSGRIPIEVTIKYIHSEVVQCSVPGARDFVHFHFNREI